MECASPSAQVGFVSVIIVSALFALGLPLVHCCRAALVES